MQDLIEAIQEEQIIRVSGFAVNYNHFNAAKQSIRVIFNNNSPYKFDSKNPCPVIIDVGSGIGISTLYFKNLYPQSKILCFEPDINAFNILKKNIVDNQLNDVEFVNKAVSSQAGRTPLFGQNFSGNNDHRANSLVEVWGCRYKENHSVEVETRKLSDYIHAEVDFLHLDAAGCEEKILVELEAEGKLPLIKEIAIEMYQATRTKASNSLARIFSLLRQNNFEITVTEKDHHFLLEDDYTRQWAKRVKPQLFTIKALYLG